MKQSKSKFYTAVKENDIVVKLSADIMEAMKSEFDAKNIVEHFAEATHSDDDALTLAAMHKGTQEEWDIKREENFELLHDPKRRPMIYVTDIKQYLMSCPGYSIDGRTIQRTEKCKANSGVYKAKNFHAAESTCCPDCREARARGLRGGEGSPEARAAQLRTSIEMFSAMGMTAEVEKARKELDKLLSE